MKGRDGEKEMKECHEKRVTNSLIIAKLMKYWKVKKYWDAKKEIMKDKNSIKEKKEIFASQRGRTKSDRDKLRTEKGEEEKLYISRYIL